MPLVTLTAEEALARLATLRRSMSDKFGDERDPYLYPALNVLRNRLGIRQARQQAAFEMTALRAPSVSLRGRGCAAYPICALFIASCIRILFDCRLREVP